MPITPFHFGPGVLFKSTAPTRFSWTMFALSNMVIDLEPVVSYLFTGDPIHSYAHTYLGAALVAILTGYLGRAPCERCLRFWNSRMSPAQGRWLGVDPEIPVRTALISALIGTWSHIALDSIMHADIRPWWPLSEDNSLRGVIDLSMLHLLCVAVGVWGLMRLLAQRWDALAPVSSNDMPTINAPRTLPQVARAVLGLSRTAVGVLTAATLFHSLYGMTSTEALRTSQFDSQAWRDAASLAYTDPNPRFHMTASAADWLNKHRPSRPELIQKFGEPKHSTEQNMSYWAGGPGGFSWKRMLIVHFADDGSFDRAEVMSVE
jgi:hypothetical protein